MKAAETVPVELFESLYGRFGAERETYAIEESSMSTADVAVIDPKKSGVVCAISLERFTRGGRSYAMFRLWPNKPEKERWLVYAAKPIFTVRGGPIETWSPGEGGEYKGSVTLDYGHYSTISLSSEWGRKMVAFMAVILDAASLLAVETTDDVTWSEETRE